MNWAFLILVIYWMAVLCPACERSFKSAQGLALHWRTCRQAAATTVALVEGIERKEEKERAAKIARRTERDVGEQRRILEDHGRDENEVRN